MEEKRLVAKRAKDKAPLHSLMIDRQGNPRNGKTSYARKYSVEIRTNVDSKNKRTETTAREERE